MAQVVAAMLATLVLAPPAAASIVNEVGYASSEFSAAELEALPQERAALLAESAPLKRVLDVQIANVEDPDDDFEADDDFNKWEDTRTAECKKFGDAVRPDINSDAFGDLKEIQKALKAYWEHVQGDSDSFVTCAYEDGTPLSQAVAMGNEKVVKELLSLTDMDDKTKFKWATQKDESGMTILHEAALWGRTSAAEALVNEITIDDRHRCALFQEMVDTKNKNFNGLTPIEIAVACEKTEGCPLPVAQNSETAAALVIMKLKACQ